MKNLQVKLKEIFEPGTEETRIGTEETTRTNGFDIRAFEDGRGGYYILDSESLEMCRTAHYETMIEFVSERVGGWDFLNY